MPEYIEREAVHRMMVGLTRYSWKSPVSNESHVTVDADAVNFGVDKILAADVASVVRCKDCYHKTEDGNGKPYCLELEMYLNKELDFFCSYGERRDGEG